MKIAAEGKDTVNKQTTINKRTEVPWDDFQQV